MVVVNVLEGLKVYEKEKVKINKWEGEGEGEGEGETRLQTLYCETKIILLLQWATYHFHFLLMGQHLVNSSEVT